MREEVNFGRGNKAKMALKLNALQILTTKESASILSMFHTMSTMEMVKN